MVVFFLSVGVMGESVCCYMSGVVKIIKLHAAPLAMQHASLSRTSLD